MFMLQMLQLAVCVCHIHSKCHCGVNLALISNSTPIGATPAKALCSSKVSVQVFGCWSAILNVFSGAWRLIWILISLKCSSSNVKAKQRTRDATAVRGRVEQVCREEEWGQFIDILASGQWPVAKWFTLIFIAEEALNHKCFWQTTPGGVQRWCWWPCLAALLHLSLFPLTAARGRHKVVCFILHPTLGNNQ